ncbi:MAG TPA: hypothetical protein VMV29_23415 [Ktedonobacterales bacterium]|nr:hypothetical protein [Ktedonobacterales bacterium]
MKAPLRPIVVDSVQYRWRFITGYVRTDDPGNLWVCQDTFTAYLDGDKGSPLRIHFVTWEDAIVGGPLRSGAEIALGQPETAGANLHTPHWAARLIRLALERGWRPSDVANAPTRRAPFIIADGVELLLAFQHSTR